MRFKTVLRFAALVVHLAAAAQASVLFGGRMNPDRAWAVVDPEDQFLFQFAGGQAIARYVAGVAGRGEDAAYDPGTDAFVPLPIIAWQLSYGHQLKPGLRSYASAGLVRVFERGFQPGNAFSRSSYVSANAMWIPSPGLRTGIEYSWGRRQDKNGQSGN